MSHPILSVHSLTVRLSGRLVLENVHVDVQPGECMAIAGSTGSGKTSLVNALADSIFYTGSIRFSPVDGRPPKRVVIGRQHGFKNLSNISSFYYQQRFNSFDAEDSRTVEAELALTGAGPAEITQVLEKMGIAHLRNTGLIKLSNGEHKRFQLAEALLRGADWLLLDCPYTGLDIDARKRLNHILDELVRQGKHMLLVTAGTDLPACITRVGILEKGKLVSLLDRRGYDELISRRTTRQAEMIEPKNIARIPPAYAYDDFNIAVKMVNTTIAYDGRTILDRINWEVQKGDCWHLAGPNGSGKSTLLSLINGDNPQAFANEIYLFDRRKGSGESIWDIKRKIGYVSPELHHYFEKGSNCLDIVASGLFDTMGLFRKLNEQQVHLTWEWMELLHVRHLAEKYFQQLSDGEQRRVLLARAMVKNPPMLILDEPCQGLDDAETESFTGLVDSICRVLGKTLIYVSHYASELPACVNKRIELLDGKVKAVISR